MFIYWNTYRYTNRVPLNLSGQLQIPWHIPITTVVFPVRSPVFHRHQWENYIYQPWKYSKYKNIDFIFHESHDIVQKNLSFSFLPKPPWRSHGNHQHRCPVFRCEVPCVAAAPAASRAPTGWPCGRAPPACGSRRWSSATLWQWLTIGKPS